MLMAAIAGLFLARGKFDVIYATSPPLFTGGAALFISYLRRIPMMFEVRDLWPETAVQMGELNRKWAISLATWLEERCYRRARRIIAVTRGIKARLLERGLNDDEVTVIPNGANTDNYRPLTPDPILRESLGFKSDHFIIIYTGLLGLIHGLETILESADLLSEHKDIRFLIVGDGPRREALHKHERSLGLQNVIFHDAVPEDRLPDFIALSDVGIHVQRRLEISTMALPVKMFSYLACERPVLLALEGEAAEFVRDEQVGLVVPPEQPAELARAILELKNNPQKCRTFGVNGRKVIEAHFSRQAQAVELAALLDKVLR
jgi:colanic acid biosynthesis glycosyl transferase WcaI